MKILDENSIFPKRVSLILGFFDGIHAGHQDVINNTDNTEKVIVTFSSSPAEYFNKNFDYIYTRQTNYKLMEKLGISYIYEQNFASIAKVSANDYLNNLVTKFNPKSITTGFNHTFGANKQGNPKFLEKFKDSFEYYCTAPTTIANEVVSSTKIKDYLKLGEIELANQLLTRNFHIESAVIEGIQLGRKLGFPTANMKYPQNIVKLPYGVYKVRANNMPAILNWGIKPTVNSSSEESEEILEVHIPNFNSDLYGKNLIIEFISKIRDEKRFNNLEDLKNQIEKDIIECLK